MTDALDKAERNAFAALGFTISGGAARIEGATVEASQHGAWHFLLRIELPCGAVVTAFMPKTRILGGGDAS
jgi:hypothetical protein